MPNEWRGSNAGTVFAVAGAEKATRTSFEGRHRCPYRTGSGPDERNWFYGSLGWPIENPRNAESDARNARAPNWPTFLTRPFSIKRTNHENLGHKPWFDFIMPLFNPIPIIMTSYTRLSQTPFCLLPHFTYLLHNMYSSEMHTKSLGDKSWSDCLHEWGGIETRKQSGYARRSVRNAIATRFSEAPK